MKSETLILGLIAGLSAGILIGILFAPEKGSKLRRKILKRGSNYSKVFLEIMDDFHESVPEKYKSYKQKAQEADSKFNEN